MFAGSSILHILAVVVPALLVAWLLAVWLPGRGFGRGLKILLGILLSFIVFTLSSVILFATGGARVHNVPTDITYIKFYGLGFWALSLLFTMPLMAVADALLYFGGRAVRTRHSSSRVFVGYMGGSLGILLWIAAVLSQVWLVAYGMEL